MREDGKYNLPYLINFTESRLGHSLASLEAGTSLNHTLRTFNFKGSTDQMILFYHQEPGCVHIVDPDLDAYNPLLPAVIREYAPSSRDDLIFAQEKQNNVFFLSEKTSNSWCYYYQKASLAAELGNGSRSLRLPVPLSASMTTPTTLPNGSRSSKPTPALTIGTKPCSSAAPPRRYPIFTSPCSASCGRSLPMRSATARKNRLPCSSSPRKLAAKLISNLQIDIYSLQ